MGGAEGNLEAARLPAGRAARWAREGGLPPAAARQPVNWGIWGGFSGRARLTGGPPQG
jgi:hypothetical protein